MSRQLEEAELERLFVLCTPGAGRGIGFDDMVAINVDYVVESSGTRTLRSLMPWNK
jgi:hypothetical protein